MKALAVAKVRKISSVEQWMAILEKYKDRLVFAHFAGSKFWKNASDYDICLVQWEHALSWFFGWL